MRFKGLDLNLLVTLDKLLTEKNVSRAAEKLNLSQSATSGALARLREYFDDELLTQIGRTMVLTPRAAQLSNAVRRSLMQIEGSILQHPDFDPATVKRNIKIIASDYIAIAGLSGALREIKSQAPDLQFSLQPPQADPIGALERGEVEFVAMPEMYLAPDHPSETLFAENYVVVVWKENQSIGLNITLEEFLKQRHVTVAFPNSRLSYESWVVEHYGNERIVDIEVGSFSSLPFMLIGTKRIALMHERLANVFVQMMPLRILPSPINIPALHEGLQWNVFNDGDKCLIWVRNMIIEGMRTPFNVSVL